MDHTITLQYFIRKQGQEQGGSGRFTNILLSIATGTKIVSQGVNRAGLASLLGKAGETNVQGEEVQKLDIYANNVFESVLGRCGEFVSMVSEEEQDVLTALESDGDSHFVIAFDPLDGSSNIDVNVSIGTIWGIYKKRPDVDNPEAPEQFYQAGTEQVAAGYTIYGSSTMFVYTTGNGVHGFTLDPSIGEFVLTHPDMQIPNKGKIYSCNEGNFDRWSKGVQEYVKQVKNSEEPRYSQRYVGSLVADFHRTMLKGGIFFYPADTKNKSGKLRHLYECAPMAMIAEQAGGKASDGTKAILSIVPESIHERTPLFIGSPENVDELEAAIKQHES